MTVVVVRSDIAWEQTTLIGSRAKLFKTCLGPGCCCFSQKIACWRPLKAPMVGKDGGVKNLI